MSQENSAITSGSRFASFTSQTFFALLFCQALSVVAGIIIARILGPAGKGAVAVITLCPNLLFVLGNLSIYRAITVSLGEKQYPFGDYAGTAFSYSVGASVLLGAGFILVYFAFNGLFVKEIGFSTLLLSLCMLPSLLLTQNFNSILQAKGRIREINAANILQSLGFLSITAAVLLAARKGVTGVIAAYCFSYFLWAAAFLYFTRNVHEGRWRYNGRLLKSLIFDGCKLHIGVVANFICWRVNMLILLRYLGYSGVGIYTVAASFAEAVFLVTFAIQTVFYYKVSESINDRSALNRKTALVYKHSFVLLSLFSLALAVAAGPVIRLFYGGSFIPSVKPILILLPGTFFFWLNNILTNYLVGMKRFLTVSAIASLASAVSMALNIFLIPRFGIAGAALASTGAYLVIGCATIAAFLNVSGHTPATFLKELSFKREDFLVYRRWASGFLQGFS